MAVLVIKAFRQMYVAETGYSATTHGSCIPVFIVNPLISRFRFSLERPFEPRKYALIIHATG